jgi:hypothetical protein
MSHIIQNYQLLLNEIPSTLKNLSYAIYPTDKTYNDVRFIYNKLFNYFPHAIFYPESEKQVSYLIQNLSINKLEFAIRCGGHAYEPASLSIGYIIDVYKFSKITVEKGFAIVGSGVRLGNLITALGKKNYIAATGEAASVGISGLSLAGGKGYLTRLYGMACDNILEVDLINYEGKLIKANSNTNSDLFWAIKGAGIGNFGVITQFKIKTYPDIMCKITKISWSTYNKLLAGVLIQKYQETILKNTVDSIVDLSITYNNKNMSISIEFFQFGASIQSDSYINNQILALKNLLNLLNQNPTVSEHTGYYSQLTDYWVSTNNGLSPPFSKLKSTMVFTPIDIIGISKILDSFEQMLTKGLNIVYSVNFSQLGGAVKSGNSAYFPKDALFSITMPLYWTDPVLNTYCISWINKIHQTFIPFTSAFSFPNMIDYDLSDYMNSYYGKNRTKLIDIKTKYDPNNIFKWYQSIPLKK